jgi:diaminopimelate epimerase
MTKINFLKMSGASNDFVIIDVRKDVHQFTLEQIAKISERKNIGCDQFVLLKDSKVADIFMEIYNSDGSQIETCGNATRCVAAILLEEKSASEVRIETKAGVLLAWNDGDLIAVNMGKPRLSWEEIPLREEKDTNDFEIERVDHRFTAVNIGNPHVVSFINKDLSDDEFFVIAPFLATNPLFPNQTNVEFAQILGPNHIKVRVWERGTGETLACGSGACAVAVAAIRKNLVARDKIKISFKGGDVFVKLSEDGSVIMSGGYQKIFSGVFDEGFL